MNLLEELTNRNDQALIDGVTNAIGPVAPRADVFGTVAGHYLDFTNPDVLAVYIISAGRLIRYESVTDGTHLTSCISMSRVARVSEEHSNTKTTVVVELDADRTTLSGTVQTLPPAAANMGGDAEAARRAAFLVTGNLFPAGWVIEASEPRAQARLGRFAARVRAAQSRVP